MPVPGRSVAVLVDEYDMTNYLSEFEFEREAEDIDVSHFGSRVRSYLSGPQETTVTLTGWYDGGTNQIDEIFHQRFGAPGDSIFTLCPDTAAFGKSCYLIPTTQVSYNLSTEVEEAVEIEAEFRANGFVDRGHILQPAVNLSAATTTGTAIVSPAATEFGGVAHLHVLGGTVGGTTPSIDVVVEHSADGTTWTPLITFDSYSAPGPLVGKQRKSTALTATVNEQVRATVDVAGTSNVTCVVSFARGLGF